MFFETNGVYAAPQTSQKMETLHVIIYALLWSLMEVQIEGKHGWMYESQTQCSGLLAFTWYHVVMNVIAVYTVTLIVRPKQVVVGLYNILVWFVVEDVGWFVMNGMTYRTAPWQTTAASLLSTVLPLLMVLYMKRRKVERDYRWDAVLLPVILYIWLPFGTPFDPAVPYTPRHSYCD